MNRPDAPGGDWVERLLPGGITLRCLRYQSTVPFSDLVVESAVREACATCPQHGLNFSCPPHSPLLADYVGDAARATVICVRLSLDHLEEPDPRLRQRQGFRQGQLLLAEELLAARSRGPAVAGCGACPSCPVCSAAEGADACRSPERRIYSLESMGVNVVDLLRRCFSIDLEWGGPEEEVSTVHAAGAVFHRE